MKKLFCLTGILLFTIASYAQDCKLNEEAQRYWGRANAAIKEAKNNVDYVNAAEELKKALQYAPDCPDIYYNIGICYEKSAGSGLFEDLKSYSEAIKYFKKYVELKPHSSDRQTVQNRVYELEYKYDKLNEQLPEMVFVEGGKFGKGRQASELNSFYIGKYEVTQKQWQMIMGTTLEQMRDKNNKQSGRLIGVGDNYPMYYLRGDDVQEFIKRLNAVTDKRYRLPTEAEWEYAARGGSKSQEYKYSGSNKVDNVAWRDKTTHAVGTKSPNELGIYDMSGNVWELCSNSSGSDYVLRGGSCFYNDLSVSSREKARLWVSSTGFRLILQVDGAVLPAKNEVAPPVKGKEDTSAKKKTTNYSIIKSLTQ